MRISDWSSDVCSSDLEGHVAKVPEVVVERRHLGHEGAGRGKGAVLRDHRGASGLRQRRGDPLDAHADEADPRHDRRSPHVRGSYSFWVAPSITGALGATCGGLERSEEHTSELKSIMRISYAVF